MTKIPKEVDAALSKSFLSGRSVYGQVATIDSGGYAQVRTVHFHYIQADQAIAFVAHKASPKWTQLEKTQKSGGCYFDTENQIQIRWHGDVDLNREDLLPEIWSHMREETRASYWLDQLKLSISDPIPTGTSLDEIPENIGVVYCRPKTWDLFWNNPAKYRTGIRKIFRQENQTWSEKRVSLLNSFTV